MKKTFKLKQISWGYRDNVIDTVVIREVLKDRRFMDRTCIGRFDGGNDSGGCTINGDLFEPTENDTVLLEWHPSVKLTTYGPKAPHEEFAQQLSMVCADELAYGGFAGNFEVKGDIYYDPETEEITMVGEEIDYETEIPIGSISRSFEVDPGLMADEVNIGFSTWEDTHVELVVRHGTLSERDRSYQQKLLHQIEEFVSDIVDAQKDYDDANGSYFFSDTISLIDISQFEIGIDINKNRKTQVHTVIDLVEQTKTKTTC